MACPAIVQIQHLRSGLCMDIKNGSYSDGNEIQIYGCNRTIAQKWQLLADRTIRSNNKCLVPYGGKSDHIMIYDCKAARQDWIQWQLEPDGHLKHVGSGLYLDATGNPQSGTELILWDRNDTQAQDWSITKTG